MLRESELRVLEISEGKSIKGIAKAMESNTGHVSRAVISLEKKGLVETERGREKTVYLTNNKALELYQELTEKHSHIDFAELLKGKAIPVLYYLEEPRTVKEIAEKTDNYRYTTHRIIKRLLHRGIVKKEDSKYRLKEEFQTLNEFAKEYVHHMHRKKTEKSYTILWESLHEFLCQTGERIEEENFLVTGPELFQEYGLPLLTKGKNHYFYTKKEGKVTPNELICHTLLMDKGTRYQSYCLLLIKKEKVTMDELMVKAEKYGLEETIRSLETYLETEGEEKTSKQPDWDELKDLAEEYGVEL